MSKRVDVTVKCPECRADFPATLYRSIWGEYPKNRVLVLIGAINVVRCPHCQHSIDTNFPFLYTNRDLEFALWWEPTHDPMIDFDSRGYAEAFGSEHYLAKAPRFSHRAEFTSAILEFEKEGHGPPVVDARYTGQNEIVIPENGDMADVLYQSARVWTRTLTAGWTIAETFEQWCNVRNGIWTETAIDKFARGLVQWMQEDEAPVPELRESFELARASRRLGKHQEIPREVRSAYAELLGASLPRATTPSTQSIPRKQSSARNPWVLGFLVLVVFVVLISLLT